MSENNIFEVAVRNKFRFAFKGLLSVEDLFDLSLNELDSIFKKLNSQLRQVNEESLLDNLYYLEDISKADKELEIKIEIIKYIASIKKEEINAKLKAKEKSKKKQELLEIYHEKKNADLHSKSIEDIEKMLNELDD
jgi:hypothetical protein